MKPSQLEIIKKTIQEFFDKATFETQVEVSPAEEERVSARIKIDDPKILIGEGGQTLAEIQHLLKLILRPKIEDNFYLDVDINNYKKKKIEYLIELARASADEVSLMKKEKILDPMPAFERRIIHKELGLRADVKTESIGEEPERKIVIRPAS